MPCSSAARPNGSALYPTTMVMLCRLLLLVPVVLDDQKCLLAAMHELEHQRHQQQRRHQHVHDDRDGLGEQAAPVAAGELQGLPQLALDPWAEDDADDQRQHRQPEPPHHQAEQAEDQQQRQGPTACTFTASAPSVGEEQDARVQVRPQACARQELLGVGGDAVGRRVDGIGLDPAVVEFLLSGDDRRDVVIATRTRVLALNRRSATSQGQVIGTVTTMRDSTELAALQGQLSSHKSVTDTLRAQTHEFANQLHTISGLVQLGEYDSVRDLVGTLTRRRAEINDAVTRRISDPAVAALLIAKTSLAAESGVSLQLAPESHLAALTPAVATDVITLLGNLIDNAVDVSVGADPARATCTSTTETA